MIKITNKQFHLKLKALEFQQKLSNFRFVPKSLLISKRQSKKTCCSLVYKLFLGRFRHAFVVSTVWGNQNYQTTLEVFTVLKEVLMPKLLVESQAELISNHSSKDFESFRRGGGSGAGEGGNSMCSAISLVVSVAARKLINYFYSCYLSWSSFSFYQFILKRVSYRELYPEVCIVQHSIVWNPANTSFIKYQHLFSTCSW